MILSFRGPPGHNSRISRVFKPFQAFSRLVGTTSTSSPFFPAKLGTTWKSSLPGFRSSDHPVLITPGLSAFLAVVQTAVELVAKFKRQACDCADRLGVGDR